MELTPRELEVVEYIAAGYIDAEIARLLGTSTSTVNTQVISARMRLNARNRAHLVAIAYQRGMLNVKGHLADN